MASRVEFRPKYVSAFKDRGQTRFVFRRVGYKTAYLRGPLGSPEFAEDLANAMANELVVGQGRVKARSVADLLIQFYASNAFKGAGADRQARVKGILEPFRNDYGDHLVASFEFSDIEAILQKTAIKRKCEKSGRTIGGTGAAASLKKQLNRIFEFAREKLKWINHNPAKAADAVKHHTKGRHTWSEDEIAQYRAHHAIGTTARASLEIMLWTAQRKGDACDFGPAHLRGGKIRIEPDKGANREQVLWLPAAPQLLAAIEALKVKGTRTFLVTEFGKAFTKNGFGNKVREWCDDAGLPQCASHGLRKAAARRAAELGGTHAELKAIGGWANSAEVDTYIAAANQAQMAETGMNRIIDWEAGLANMVETKESKLSHSAS